MDGCSSNPASPARDDLHTLHSSLPKATPPFLQYCIAWELSCLQHCSLNNCSTQQAASAQGIVLLSGNIAGHCKRKSLQSVPHSSVLHPAVSRQLPSTSKAKAQLEDAQGRCMGTHTRGCTGGSTGKPTALEPLQQKAGCEA